MENQLEKERLEREERERITLERKRLEKETREFLLAKQKEKQYIQEQMERAKRHCEKRRVQYYVINPLKKILQMQKKLDDKASCRYDVSLLSHAFGVIKKRMRQKEELLEQKADSVYRFKMAKSSFNSFGMVRFLIFLFTVRC
jgi:hypothetical protein